MHRDRQRNLASVRPSGRRCPVDRPPVDGHLFGADAFVDRASEVMSSPHDPRQMATSFSEVWRACLLGVGRFDAEEMIRTEHLKELGDRQTRLARRRSAI
jgi:hypothetical protein